MHRNSARSRRCGQPAPTLRPETRPESAGQGVAQATRSNNLEQRATQPVRLYHPPVERVADPICPGDQLQVRPGALERAGQLAQRAIVAAGRLTPDITSFERRLTEQFVDGIRSAIAKSIRTERIACEEDRP